MPPTLLFFRTSSVHPNHQSAQPHKQPLCATLSYTGLTYEHLRARCWCALRFSDDAVSEEAAEHQFKLVRTQDDLSEAFFELK